MTKLSITDLAIRERESYKRTLDMALRGVFGEVIRDGHRLYVVVPETREGGAIAQRGKLPPGVQTRDGGRMERL